MENLNPETFEDIVQWAFSTLPERIKELPDFPGIQIVDEPPAEVFNDLASRKKWPAGTELLGLYSGLNRTEPHHFQTRIAPDLIFIFRGPLLRCSRGNLRGEVKQVVWHEVAHWLGNDENAVKELGLSSPSAGSDQACYEIPRQPIPETAHSESVEKHEEVEFRPRCIHCYSAEVNCRSIIRPLSYSFDPTSVRRVVYTCGSCGFEWEDDDDA